MRYSRSKQMVAATALFTALGWVAALAQTPDHRGMGRAPTQEELQAGDRAAGPSGKDLPPGSGSAREGAGVYLAKCAMCHGANLQGALPPPGSGSFMTGWRLEGGRGKPLWGTSFNDMGGAQYFAYATTLWNAIARSMPLYQAGTLGNDEAYAVTAYVLFRNEIIKEGDVMNRETLPKVEMPNRHGFIPDRLEDIPNIEKRGCYKTHGVCP